MHAKGVRTGTKWWNEKKQQWEGGGSDSVRGSHTHQNKKAKERKERAKARRQEQDEADPAGAFARSKARSALAAQQQLKNNAREQWFESECGETATQWYEARQRLWEAEATGWSSSWKAAKVAEMRWPWRQDKAEGGTAAAHDDRPWRRPPKKTEARGR